MTEHHPDDDLIRASLQAESEDIHAGDHLLDRIRAEATRPSRIRQVGPWLLAGAAAVAAVALAAVALQDDQPDTVDTAGDPPTTITPTTTPTTTPSTADTAPEGPSVEQPSLVALVREDGWLVTVDLTSGEETELYSAGDPREEIEGGPYFVDSVELSPDSQWIYFSTCCEPAAGVSFRIPTSGGEPEQIGFGAYPKVSPDGRFVATADAIGVTLYRTDQVGSDAVARVDTGCCVSRLAWSPDGTRLAFVYGQGSEPGDFLAGVLDWDGTTLTVGDMGKPEVTAHFVTWMPDGMSVAAVGDSVADDRTLTQDASYRWLLWVDETGAVSARAGYESPEQTEIDVPRALAADW